MNLMQANQNVLSFENKELGSIRVLEKDGEIWFVAKDVCDVLGYVNVADAIAKHVDKEDKDFLMSQNAILENVPNRGLIIINESGLYSLILRSNKSEAKKFKRWVTSEVLPAIRKTGMYLADYALIENRLAETRKQAVAAITYLLNKKNEYWLVRLQKYLKLGLTEKEIAKLLDTTEEDVLICKEFLEMAGLFSSKDVIVKKDVKALYLTIIDETMPFYQKYINLADKIEKFIWDNTSESKQYFTKTDICSHLGCKADDFYLAVEYLQSKDRIKTINKKGKNNRYSLFYYIPGALNRNKIPCRTLSKEQADRLFKKLENKQ